MIMTCIALDDEPIALTIIETYLRSIPELTLLKKFTDASHAFDYLTHNPVDLLISDIHMPDISGLEFVRSLPEERPMVIFLTAYKEHAHIGFDMQVVDYLVKPVAPDRFERAIKKAYALFERTMDTVPLTRLDHPDHFFVFSDYVQIKIVISEIQFIESMGDYVKIHLDGKKKPVITLERLKNMAQRLHDLGFKRIHRSYLVNIAKVEAKQKSQVKVGNIWIPVGERFSID